MIADLNNNLSKAREISYTQMYVKYVGVKVPYIPSQDDDARGRGCAMGFPLLKWNALVNSNQTFSTSITSDIARGML